MWARGYGGKSRRTEVPLYRVYTQLQKYLSYLYPSLSYDTHTPVRGTSLMPCQIFKVISQSKYLPVVGKLHGCALLSEWMKTP